MPLIGHLAGCACFRMDFPLNQHKNTLSKREAKLVNFLVLTQTLTETERVTDCPTFSCQQTVFPFVVQRVFSPSHLPTS